MAEFKVSYDPPKGKPLGTNFAFKFGTKVLIPIFRVTMKRDWRGIENLPKTGRVIVASNHLSYLDVLVLTDFLFTNGRAPRYLGKAGVFRTPIIGKIILAAGQIPVERESSDARKAVDHAKILLEKGHLLGVYPEGTLTEENIRDAVLNVARYDVFQLTESLLAGDLARFNRMVDGLEGEGEPLVLILWTVTEEVRLLNRLRQALDRGDNLQMLMKMNRVWGNKERLIPQALQRLSADRLQKALMVTSGLDQQSKGLQIRKGAGPILEKLPSDPWDGLRMLGRLFV